MKNSNEINVAPLKSNGAKRRRRLSRRLEKKTDFNGANRDATPRFRTFLLRHWIFSMAHQWRTAVQHRVCAIIKSASSKS